MGIVSYNNTLQLEIPRNIVARFNFHCSITSSPPVPVGEMKSRDCQGGGRTGGSRLQLLVTESICNCQ